MAAATHRRLRPPAVRAGSQGTITGADTVVIGGRSHALRDVVSYEVEADEQRDCEGQILCAGIYGLAASLLLFAVMVGVLDWTFIIAVVFIGAIALMCLADAIAVKPVTIYRLRMEMNDGQQATFAAGEWELVSALADRIDRLM